ncbi:MAG: hypothetical protein AAB877_01695 [Patescibacteria group bacterium]
MNAVMIFRDREEINQAREWLKRLYGSFEPTFEDCSLVMDNRGGAVTINRQGVKIVKRLSAMKPRRKRKETDPSCVQTRIDKTTLSEKRKHRIPERIQVS